MKGKKHWLTFETEEGHPGLRLDKSNFEEILSAVDRRLKYTLEFDGYQERARRMDPPSLENKDTQGSAQSPGIEEALSEALSWDPGSLEMDASSQHRSESPRSICTRNFPGACADGSLPTWRICRTSSATTRSTDYKRGVVSDGY